jgi:hypothetical protein
LQSGHDRAGLLHYLSFGAKLGLRGVVALGLRFARAVRELFRLRRAALSDAAKALREEHDRRVSRLAAATRIGADRLRRLIALQARPITSSVRGILTSVLLDRVVLAVVWTTAIAALLTSGVLGKYTVHACVVGGAAWIAAHVLVARQRIVDPAARMIERAAHLANLFPAAFVVMGHTHVPVAVRAGDATYINVGSWAEDEAEPGPAARTHLVIDVGPNGAEARFCVWGPEGPRPLA